MQDRLRSYAPFTGIRSGSTLFASVYEFSRYKWVNYNEI